jgi:putative SOS response-associated peptidase YedK
MLCYDERKMCGRAYETYTADELYFQYLNKRPVKLQEIAPNYNLCPTQISPVLRMAAGERQFDEMQWQLIPRWEPAFKTKLSTINAKSETVFESRLFRTIVVRQRCIVPLSGFFEWKNNGAKKRPFKIYMADKSIMSVAGIWDTWHGGSPDERRSFTIMTTSANKLMRGIHDRMPVILGSSSIDEWLDPEVHEIDALRKLLQPCPTEWLGAAEISTLVNSPRNNSPDVLENISRSASGL